MGARFGAGALWLLSLLDAPRGAILRLDVERPGASTRLVLPGGDGAVADWTVTAGRIYVTYRDSGPSVL